MGKNSKDFQQAAPPRPKAIVQLVDAFTDAYRCVANEEECEEIFNIRRLRSYFQAWPLPKMLDPLPPYLEELERRGYGFVNTFDGNPAILCVRR